MTDKFNLCKDVTVSTARMFSQALKDENKVHLLIYGLYTARVTRKALENSDLQEVLTSYSEHPRFGAMAQKILQRFEGIAKGNSDPFNKLMEEEFGFQKENHERENPSVPKPVEQRCRYQQVDFPSVAPFKTEDQYLFPRRDDFTLSVEVPDMMKPCTRKEVAPTGPLWFNLNEKPVTSGKKEDTRTCDPRREIPKMSTGIQKAKAPYEHQTNKWNRREKWTIGKPRNYFHLKDVENGL